MRAHHRVLLAGLVKHRRVRAHVQANDSYLGSGHRYYDVSIPVLRKLAKEWLREHKGISDADFSALLVSLYGGKSYEEKILGSILLSYHRAARRTIGTKQLNAWLDGLAGWAEIDSICILWTAGELTANWREWQRFIRALSRDDNINRRRAALVFLTTPVHGSSDERIAALGFEVIDQLKTERNKMITKAVSWLLRSMTRHHERAVADYIRENRTLLPAIAVRETMRKIATGRK